MSSLEGIEKISALSRIAEIQQRIKDIERTFGGTIKGADFQTILENEMAQQTEKFQNIKPIEEFLAENKLQPVNETSAINTEKVVKNLQFGGVRAQEENLSEEIPHYETAIHSENSAPTLTEQMIINAARKFGVDSELVKAVATAESNLNQNARSNVGAIGVMQLMPETAEDLGVNPYDEKQNIEGGAHYLRQMLDKFNGNVRYAIAAYNAGPGAVQKYGGVPPYNETQNYVGRVLDFYVR